MDDPDYIKDCQLNISGFYYFNLLTEDIFRGQIELSDNPATTNSMTDIKIRSGGDVIQYTYKQSVDEETDPIRMYYYLGLLFSKPLMRNMCILAYYKDYNEYGEARPGGYGGSWNGLTGFCIVSSVKSREEAIDILNYYGLIQP